MKKVTIPVKTTLLDYAILGLIHEEPRSGYNIRMVFETTAMGIFSSSPGSIYPALKRLEKNKLVGRKESGKNHFHISLLGIEILSKWLVCPIEKVDIEKNRDELFLRFAFMENLLSKEQKLTFLKDFHAQLKAYIKELNAFHRMEGPNLPLHGRLSFEHGIASCKTTLKWCKNTIALIAATS